MFYIFLSIVWNFLFSGGDTKSYKQACHVSSLNASSVQSVISMLMHYYLDLVAWCYEVIQKTFRGCHLHYHRLAFHLCRPYNSMNVRSWFVLKSAQSCITVFRSVTERYYKGETDSSDIPESRFRRFRWGTVVYNIEKRKLLQVFSFYYLRVQHKRLCGAKAKLFTVSQLHQKSNRKLGLEEITNGLCCT